MKMKKKREIHAVHESDLDDFLENIGLLEDLENGKLICDICGCKVSRENFRCVYPIAGEIKICCSKLECYQKALTKVKGDKLG